MLEQEIHGTPRWLPASLIAGLRGLRERQGGNGVSLEPPRARLNTETSLKILLGT